MTTTEELFDTTPYLRTMTRVEVDDIDARFTGGVTYNSRTLSDDARDILEQARPGRAGVYRVYGHWVSEHIGVSYDKDGNELPKLAVSFKIESFEQA